MRAISKGMYSALILASTVLVFSCFNIEDLSLPESVSVKTDAAYTVPLGTASYDVSSVLGADALKSSMQSSLGTSANLYDYVPDSSSDTLTYLLHYPVYSVPLDVGSYLDSLNMGSALNSGDVKLDFNQDIVLPTIAINQTQKIDIPDISTQVFNSMNTTLANGDFTCPTVKEPGAGNTVSGSDYLLDQNGNAHNSITISGDVDGEITYDTGSAVLIKVTRNDTNALTSSYTFNMTAAIKDAAETILYTTTTESVTDGGTLTLNLGDTAFPKDLHVLLNSTLSGGNNSVTHSYTVTMTLAPATKIRQIDKLNSTAKDLGITLPTINQSVDLSDMVGYFTTSTIDVGSVSIKAVMPSTWTGISCKDGLKFSGSGMGENTLADGTPDGTTYLINKYLDLHNKTLNPSESDHTVTVAADTTDNSLNLTFSNAKIIFENGSSAQTINVDVVCSVTTLSSATIDFTSAKYASVPHHYSLPTDGSSGSVKLSNELVQYVRTIDFGSEDTVNHYKHNGDGSTTTTKCNVFGITCKVVNSFPSGNNIPITLTSAMFGYNYDASVKGTGTTDATDATWTKYPNVTMPPYVEGDSYYADFSVTMHDTLELTNLSLGNTYSFGISDATLLNDWDYIYFDASSKDVKGEQDLSSFNITSLLSALPISAEDIKKIQIAALPVYFYAQKPTNAALKNLIGDVEMDGAIATSYTDSNSAAQKEYILGSESGGTVTTESVTFADAISWPTDTTTTITSTTAGVSSHIKYSAGDSAGASFYKDFAPIINQYPTNLKLTYDMKMSGTKGSSIKIYSKTIDEVKADPSGSTTSIDIDMAAVFAFKLNLVDKITLNIMKFTDDTWETDTTKDLLSREGASSYDSYLTYANAIDYFKMNYSLTNELLPDLPLELDVIDRGASGLNKKISFKNGNNSFSLSVAEIKNVMTTYPFHPDIDIVLGNDETTAANPTIIALQRSALVNKKALAASVNVSIKMNGDTPITVWGGAE